MKKRRDYFETGENGLAPACARHQRPLVGGVEDWRGTPEALPWPYPPFPASCPFRGRRRPVSSPRPVKPGGPISGTGLSCSLRAPGYGTYRLGALSARTPRVPAYSASISRIGLRRGVNPPLRGLAGEWALLSGRPCFPRCERNTNSRVPWLQRHSSPSSLLWTPPPPSRLPPTSRGLRL